MVTLMIQHSVIVIGNQRLWFTSLKIVSLIYIIKKYIMRKCHNIFGPFLAVSRTTMASWPGSRDSAGFCCCHRFVKWRAARQSRLERAH